MSSYHNQVGRYERQDDGFHHPSQLITPRRAVVPFGSPAAASDGGRPLRRRAIMALAHDLARADVARAPSRRAGPAATRSPCVTRSAPHGRPPRLSSWCAARDADQAAALALNNRTALLVAELRHDRMCASMIDSLPAHLAATRCGGCPRRRPRGPPVSRRYVHHAGRDRDRQAHDDARQGDARPAGGPVAAPASSRSRMKGLPA